ncbi:SDR family NAD(P)-dependent oxidoreductase [Gordonia sp. Z-3]|uniref:SDR family NAD(P)-dependent oxidoreductase n=1 Tax=unclassified Gordonia (in: high G+C Gram-positive bacteria) TaxID=2657482 RepID=UPI002E2CEF69|nr:SDR family NAD(P)-dependent oxidoreductase [Gordonia sp. Z-3]MED5803367.1 SDR family NAD(P)-dependent oxidoreductase [Gordonia sp. Z-3]
MTSKRSHQARAVVTGAGSGIGRAFALELAARGGRVLCADIDVDRALDTVRLIGDSGSGQAEALFCDVADPDDMRTLAARAPELLGGPTSLMINNAGVGIGGRAVGDIGIDDWDWALGINLRGMVFGSELFLPQLRESGRGGLINVASAAAFAAGPGMAPYNVGKAGVLALSETISAELSGTDLAVTVLCPTFVKTNVAADGRITGEAQKLAETLMRVSGRSPEQVARQTLDANDRGHLYVVPQLEAKAIWLTKRLLPRTYTFGAGILHRLAPTTTQPADRITEGA